MRCMLVGNYGVGNVGDEALRDFFLQTFPEIEWVVLSAHPTQGEFHRFPAGIRSLLFGKWLKTRRQLKTCDAIVFGGGSLFTDTESIRACFLWFIHAWFAHRMHKPIMLAFQGVGPFRTKTGERIARMVCGWSAYISVRDQASMERVLSWKLNKKVVQTYDPVIAVISAQKEERSQKIFSIVPRKNSDKTFTSHVANILHRDAWSEIHVLSLEPGSAQEQEACRTIEALADGKVHIIPIATLHELSTHIGNSSFVLTQRFHGAVAALAMDVPFEAVHQSTKDKLYEIEQLQRDASEVVKLRQLVAEGVASLRLQFSSH